MPIYDFISSMELDILACDFHQLDSWWNFKRVNSPFSRLYYITEGEAFVTHHDTTFHLVPGSVHLIPCFTFCDLHCPERFAHYHISFTSRIPGGADILSLIQCDYLYEGDEKAKTLFKRILELNPNSRLKELDPYKQLREALKRSISGDRRQNAFPADILESEGVMRILLAPFLRNAQKIPRNMLKNKAWLGKVLTYIEENLQNELTLKIIAKQVFLHPTYFSDMFTELTGVRPIKYIAGKRIDRAHTLLLSSTKHIKEIAYECGFQNVSYFNREFKKVFHVSPGKYRDFI
jgi:AraC-like DNA-binding protein